MKECNNNLSSVNSSRVDEIWQLHLHILKGMLAQKPFELLVDENIDKIESIGYLDVLIRSGNLSFNDNQELIAAYPLSPTRTDYFVDVNGHGTGYSMCAIDALGVAFTFSRTTKIYAKDHTTEKSIFIEVNPESFENIDQELFTSYIRADDSKDNPAVQQCPQINFYSSEDDITKTSDVEILNLTQATEHAKQRFSPKAFINSINLCIRDPDFTSIR